MRYKTYVVPILLHSSIHLIKRVPQLLMIMANSINYLTTRANFTQVSPQVPITKQRNPDKFDAPDVFEGTPHLFPHATCSNHSHAQPTRKSSPVT